MSFRPCAILPSFNHHRALPAILARLDELDLPVFLIDDGSDEPTRRALADLAEGRPNLQFERLPVNRGKGAAVCHGFARAIAAGYSHAIQIDADGQHDLSALPAMLTLARANPQAIVAGQPLYDSSAPWGRRIGRWITHLCVFAETLSFQIRDSMCGLRLYPLVAVEALLKETTLGQRMDFDTEIIVKLFWRGVRPIMAPVRVIYPPDNSSNFDLWRDNWRISKMHARLLGGGLLRLPRLLGRRQAASAHWAKLAERGSYTGLALIGILFRFFGQSLARPLAILVAFYFYASGPGRRRQARSYLARALATDGQIRQVSFWEGFRLYRHFADRAVDLLTAWRGDTARAGALTILGNGFDELTQSTSGALLIVSHHGNAELSAALLAPEQRRRLTILVHTRHAENYNRLMRGLRGDAVPRFHQVGELGPAEVIALRARVERGEWIAIAGDRPAIASRTHESLVPFLGLPAPFPHGPFILAALLECPIYLLFCRRDGQGWRLAIERYAARIDLPRGQRRESLAAHVAAYAHRLEAECRAAPYQWYNLFDFWREETTE